MVRLLDIVWMPLQVVSATAGLAEAVSDSLAKRFNRPAPSLSDLVDIRGEHHDPYRIGNDCRVEAVRPALSSTKGSKRSKAAPVSVC